MCIICFDEPPNNKIDHGDHQAKKFGIEHVFDISRERSDNFYHGYHNPFLAIARCWHQSVIAMCKVGVSRRFTAKRKECRSSIYSSLVYNGVNIIANSLAD